MKRFPHLAGVLLAVAVVVGLTLALNNDYYLRILFMMGVYYLCAAGMNVLVGYAGQKSLGQAGLFAVWLNREGRPWPHAEPPDLEVSDLHQLCAWLDAHPTASTE